jgi:S-adenosyl-L-methionine hydrolase (adenosine-forming)
VRPLGLITLLTDFGNRDYFVASMKGVILTINPHAIIVDLSHDVPPHSVRDAAYLLKSCYRYFPEGTVHVAVVDPGVGTGRRPLGVRTARYYFLGPDNGLFSHIFDEEDDVEVRQIENQEIRLDSPGHTFDGRDLFAPAASWLTADRPFELFGRKIEDWRTLSIARPRTEANGVAGAVVYIDHFGNLISNLTRNHVGAAQRRVSSEDVALQIAGHNIHGLVASYAEGSKAQPSALINSNGAIEVFVKEGNAALQLKVGCGEEIVLSLGATN